MNNDLKNEEAIIIEESSFVRKNISGFIDAAIIIILFTISAALLHTKISSNVALLYILAIIIAYRLFSFMLLNGTTGMRICRVEILNDDLEKPSLKEKLLAAVFVLINGVDYYKKPNRVIIQSSERN